jgi:hypothetical protein
MLAAAGPSSAQGVQSVTATAPLASSGGDAPNLTLAGVVPAANGGTGLSSSGAAGNYLRSNGSEWTSSALFGSDIAGTVASSATFTGLLSGDVSGPQSDTRVTAIRGQAVPASTPAAGQLFVYGVNGEWVHGVVLDAGSTSVGTAALANVGSPNNLAVGASALRANVTGGSNAAIGSGALTANSTGSQNVAVGANALSVSVEGSGNTGVGTGALGALASGSSNTAIGANAGSSVAAGDRNIYLGHDGLPGDSGVIRIGDASQTATYVAGVRTSAVSAGIGVVVGPDGKLGTLVSSRRFKDEITAIETSLDSFMRLRPVTFRYRSSRNARLNPLQYGLIAEEVAAVLPELVAYDSDGQPLTVYYQFLAPILLDRVQQQRRTVEALTEMVRELERQLTTSRK